MNQNCGKEGAALIPGRSEVAIIHPYTVYDLLSDSESMALWVENDGYNVGPPSYKMVYKSH